MAYKITDDCISCGVCEPECPNDAISEGEINVIDPERCTECVGSYESSKCASICSMEACIPDPDHKESHEQLLEKWRKFHPGEAPAYD